MLNHCAILRHVVNKFGSPSFYRSRDLGYHTDGQKDNQAEWQADRQMDIWT